MNFVKNIKKIKDTLYLYFLQIKIIKNVLKNYYKTHTKKHRIKMIFFGKDSLGLLIAYSGLKGYAQNPKIEKVEVKFNMTLK